MKLKSLSAIFLLFAIGPAIRAAEVVLVKEGVAASVLVVGAEVMAPNKKKSRSASLSEREAETQRQRLRESVLDLARVLGKMSGAEIEIVHAAPAAGDRRLPVFIGAPAEKKFGVPGTKMRGKQGYRVVAAPSGVGLLGESDLATSYAIYEVLDRLGCRWYLPGEMGEVIPQKKTVTLPPMDESLTPGTLSRGIWYADDAYRRRNRMGGLLLSAAHALEINNYITKEQFAAHPEWQALVGGKRVTSRICWASEEAAAAVAEGILRSLDARPVPTISLSPEDGTKFCECEACKALDPGDWDPTMRTVSITDRYIRFCNLIAERVTKKYPEVLFGFLAYVQYTRPPTRETLHPNLVPQIAPITHCRAHTMLQKDCPSRPIIRSIVEGWRRRAKHLSYYNYMFHIAEVAVPYPMIRQMSEELPILYENGVDLWQPETMANFESVLPGFWLTIRMAWFPKAKPDEVLDEFFANFYSAAAAAMRKYWMLFDDAWTSVPEHAGCGFGYGKRFPPEFMKRARAAMDDALAACRTDPEKQRVTMQDESLKQFELFMKLREDLFGAKFATIGADAARYLERQKALSEQYAAQYAFGKAKWAPETIAGRYFKSFFLQAYDDAARIAKDFEMISPSLRAWRFAVDKEKKGESLGWHTPEFDDTAWKTTDPCLDTWFSLGLDSYYGAMFYRSVVKAPAIPAGKKVFLWISSTDGEAKVFVNGRHLSWVNEKGEKKEAFSGFCTPASFDITDAIQPDAENQITIVGTHAFINELGTGGLIGPVLVYREK